MLAVVKGFAHDKFRSGNGMVLWWGLCLRFENVVW